MAPKWPQSKKKIIKWICLGRLRVDPARRTKKVSDHLFLYLFTALTVIQYPYDKSHSNICINMIHFADSWKNIRRSKVAKSQTWATTKNSSWRKTMSVSAPKCSITFSRYRNNCRRSKCSNSLQITHTLMSKIWDVVLINDIHIVMGASLIRTDRFS